MLGPMVRQELVAAPGAEGLESQLPETDIVVEGFTRLDPPKGELRANVLFGNPHGVAGGRVSGKNKRSSPPLRIERRSRDSRDS